ncbi:Phosphoenolpyruvate-protein phosphotransferase [Kluyvera cryocrescens]|uniref:Phosphoenolpyruvate-protein phosphotransferase n=1 Tax=Kluyvera cryocrescens TaxID=580 RepID=A0A485B3D3_KLUCR|nr:Phosphoenolpyruvate-protein phosphotransferase [Kluyvera cryocrescens]
MAQYQGMLQMFNDKAGYAAHRWMSGPDKQLPYMPISEENPCLGWRGIRITLDQPEIFLVQVRAHAACQCGNRQSEHFAADDH